MKRARELLLASTLVLACALPGQAAAQETRIGSVSIQLDAPWPATVNRGYFPVWLTLHNEEGDESTLDIEIKANTWREAGREVRTRAVLTPGETRTVELYVPGFSDHGGSGSSGYSAVFDQSGETAYIPLRIGGADGPLHLLVATPARMPAGMPDVIGQRLGDTRGVKAITPASGTRAVTIGSGSSTATATPVPTAIVDFDQLPSTYHGYTSLDVVALDIRRGFPPSQKLEPLLAWVKLGGKLAVFGPGALEALRGLESGLFEERFAVGAVDPGGTLGVGPAFEVGHGRVLALDLDQGAEILSSPEHIDSVATLLVWRARGGWIPDSAGWRFDGASLEIPGLERLPLRVFLVLLLAFAFVIGPVNLMMIKRLARPALLLITIPAISILSSVGILAYGILYQGVDIKAASESITILDQRSHRCATIERRAMFVGLSPGAGLRPERGTAVFPTRLRDESESYVLDFEDGLLLRGTFLPVREPVQQMILTEGPARARLEFELKDGRVEVRNSFEVPLEGLVIRDVNGVLHYSDRRLESGDKAVLEIAEPGAGATELVGGMQGVEPTQVDLARATYVARLNVPLFTDDCGLELNTDLQSHIVHGILPADQKDW